MADNNGWNEYAKLVLAELERHNGLLTSINDKLDAIKLQQALNEQDLAVVKEEVDAFEVDIKDLKKRVYKLEQGELVEAALMRYRRWVIGGAFAVATAFIIPVVEVLIRIWG